MKSLRTIRYPGRLTVPTILFLSIVLLCSVSVSAFQLYDGDAFTVNWDTTLSYGAKWRVQDRDPDLIHWANGGNKESSNNDDGNLNFDTGLVSSAFKVTSEVEARSDYFGAFIRGTAFYDTYIMNNDLEYVQLRDNGEEQAGQDAKLLDAYVWAAHDFGDVPAMLRVGDQVVNWGESTFIRNGINAINPIDAGAIRVPGSELREALLPEGMIFGTIAPTLNTSIDGLYLYDWEETKADARGTYFSTNDFASPDGFKVIVDPFPDNGDAPVSETLMAIPRGPTREASDNGQWGVAFRVNTPALNDTEFGFYYLNYHSRLPLLASTTGTAESANTAGTIIGASQPITEAVGQHLASNPGDTGGAIAAGTAAGVNAGAPESASQEIADTAATGGDTWQTTKNQALNSYFKTAKYFTEYPEDIQLFGVSFASQMFGWSVRGEVSHRLDVPLQISDQQLLMATVGAINPNQAEKNQIGNYYGQYETDIHAYILSDITQAQVTLTKKILPFFYTDGGTFITEVGYNHAHDLPDDIDLKAPGNNSPDEDSWGYKAKLAINFFNAIGQVNLIPSIAWNHDVNGIGPAPGRTFIENRKAITPGLKATYQSWQANLTYTNYFGAGEDNNKNDRDFIGLSVKYSF